MAVINNKLRCLLLSSLFLCLDAAESLHVMHQVDECGEVDGTWRMTNNNRTNVYFLIKNREQFLELTTMLADEAENLRFPFLIMSKRSENNSVVFTIGCEEFFEAVSSYNRTQDQDDHRLVTMKDGSFFTEVTTVSKVHLIFMNHLDVGYNTNHLYPGSKELIPGYIVNVLNWYFQVYFPRAIQLGDELRERRSHETFIYTTHPWLVNLYLDCPDMTLSDIKLQCPTPEELERFRRAVWIGDIAWHAGPFNTEPESSTAELFSYSLTLSKDLDEYFGLTKKARTASNRDVPGWTKAAIPYLVENDIEALSIGVNPASAPPDVPSPNVWMFQNSSIITYWHKGGYPLEPGSTPQNPGGLSRKDCQFVKGLDEVLCFAFRQDNDGPPNNVSEIMNYYRILQYQFPGAVIRAATFEDFTSLLLPLKHTFPVVTDEIGDTWIQGPASDPVKMARYRTISRVRSRCLKSRRCDPNDERIKAMSRLLIKLPEHTYGLASDFDWTNWSNTAFQPLQYLQEGFVNDTKCWLSHRMFNDLSVQALKDHPMRDIIERELEHLKPYVPDLSKYIYHDSSKSIVCRNGMKLKIGRDGGLVQMTDVLGREWADVDNPLATIMYRTYNTTDFDEFTKQYSYNGDVGIWKPGLSNFTTAESKFWFSPMRVVLVTGGDDPCQEIYVRVITLDAAAWWKYGAPSEYLLKYSVTSNSTVDIEYQFYNKPSTRMPESLLLHFQPTPKSDHRWYVHKVGYLVDPTSVVNNGSQYVHAVDGGVTYFDSNDRGLFIESLDVATVLVQTEQREPSPFPIPLTPFNDRVTGMAYNIYNNIWETNFIYWYPIQPQDKHFKARFRLIFS